ncbi:hypothetical protein [Fischerella thermalis]|uniref:hypothetical protein n=1 Tax=Fischerella thermalis TaxID=372787 RepID=UPI0011AECCBD|nr:hypothetical protein [Fischerella thermalis]
MIYELNDEEEKWEISRRCRESGMILFSLLIEKLNSWHSWHLPCGKPLRVYIPILCNAEISKRTGFFQK